MHDYYSLIWIRFIFSYLLISNFVKVFVQRLYKASNAILKCNSPDTFIISLGDDIETKAKWGQHIVGKHIDHAYIVSGKRKTFKGTVLSFNPKRRKLTDNRQFR